MLSFFDWYNLTLSSSRPWLILGKGPSFALRTNLDLSPYHVLSLNHAVREQSVLAAHVIDLEVIEACADAIDRNAQVLVMPWYPHTKNFPGQRTLAEIAAEVPILRRLADQNRLLWYDLSTSAVRHGSGPVVQATYFSAEAALNLLAEAGVRLVRSLGVDGGSAYSGAFEDLRGSTLLANGRTSFDLQFAGFARTILRTGVDFAPLDMPAPAQVYLACAPDEVLPGAVLVHSLRRHCSLTFKAVTLAADSIGDIVEALPFEGPAVVLPPRAQVLVDLRPLFRASVGELDVLVPEHIERGAEPALAVVGSGMGAAVPALASMIRRRASFRSLVQKVHGNLCPVLSAEWNPAGSSDLDDTPLMLYYPADGSEPWISASHPLGHLWVRDLLDAVDHRLVSPDLVAEEVRLGHVRPSLYYQVEHRLEEPLLLPRRARLLDRGFTPATGRRPKLSSHWVGITRAIGRDLRRRARLLRSRHAARSGDALPSRLVGRQ
jgi:hypothetical protein